MSDVIVAHWQWMFGAMVAGGLIASMLWKSIEQHWADRTVWAGLALVCAAGVLASMRVVPGRAGERLDLALLALFFAAMGGAFGWLLRETAEAPKLAAGEWPGVEQMPAHWVRPPYLSKPGQVPWSVVVSGPDAVAAWTASRSGAR